MAGEAARRTGEPSVPCSVGVLEVLESPWYVLVRLQVKCVKHHLLWFVVLGMLLLRSHLNPTN